MARLISCSEFARRRGVTVQRVRELARAGRIPGAARVGERWVVPRSAGVLPAPAGRPRGTAFGNAFATALRRRAEERLRLLEAAARKVCAQLRAARVECVPVGSFAAGKVRPGSDLDLLIVRHPGKTWAQVDRIAARAVAGFGVAVDLVFAETLHRADKARMLLGRLR